MSLNTHLHCNLPRSILPVIKQILKSNKLFYLHPHPPPSSLTAATYTGLVPPSTDGSQVGSPTKGSYSAHTSPKSGGAAHIRPRTKSADSDNKRLVGVSRRCPICVVCATVRVDCCMDAVEKLFFYC